MQLETIRNMIYSWMKSNGMEVLAERFSDITCEVMIGKECLFRHPDIRSIYESRELNVIINYNESKDVLEFSISDGTYDLKIGWLIKDRKLELYGISGCGGTGGIDSSFAKTINFKSEGNEVWLIYSDNATLKGTCCASIERILRTIDKSRDSWADIGYKILDAFRNFDITAEYIRVEDGNSVDQAQEWHDITGARVIAYYGDLLDYMRLSTDKDPKYNPLRLQS